MKMPWTKAIESLEKKVQTTFDKYGRSHQESMKALHLKIMEQIQIVKRSEQIKHNRTSDRFMELEEIFKAELAHYRHLRAKEQKEGSGD